MDLAGMRIDREGIVAKTPNAEPIAFAHASRGWKATITSDVGQTVALDATPNCPRKIAASLYAPGASLYFDGGFELHLKTTKAPFLTWEAGSVATSVPTPKLAWVLVSFDGMSAPFMLSLPSGSESSFLVIGKPGDWSLMLQSPYTGWVRIAFPFGTHEFATSTAADLGQLAGRFKRLEERYTAPVPTLETLDIAADDDGVTASWTFSGPAVIPPALLLAPTGGYGVKLRTPYEHSGYVTELGPISFTMGRVLRVRFPCKRMGPGRAITIPGPARTMPATVSAIDIPTIVDLAVEAMRGDRDPSCQSMADEATQSYLSSAEFAMELWTRETVPYNATNRGIDLSAAYALLNQALQLGDARPPDNPFLTSVLWRTDWLTWMPFSDTPNQDIDRRAAALCVVASSMNPVPAIRLAGAILEAGLSAERGQYIQRRRAVGAQVPAMTFLEPLYAIRHQLCGTLVPGSPAPPECEVLLTSVRVLSPVAVVGKVDAKGLALQFNADQAKPLKLVLSLPPDTDASADENVETVTAQPGPENTLTFVITPKAAGTCMLRLTPLPSRGPRVSELPPYSEARL